MSDDRGQAGGYRWDTVCGNRRGKRGGRGGDAAASKDEAKFFQRASDTLPRGLFSTAEPRANLRKTLLLKKTEQQRVAIGFVQMFQSFIQKPVNLLPCGIF